MIRATFTALRTIARRPVMWLLIWTYRDVIALWSSSLAAELRRPGRVDRARLRTLVHTLWEATTETGFAIRPGRRPIQIDGVAPATTVPTRNGVGRTGSTPLDTLRV